MNTLHAARLLGIAGLGSLVALPTLAQDGGYPYAGLAVGQSRAKIDEERITASLIGQGLATTAIDRDNRDTSYKVFGGYQLNRNLGVELGWFDLGKFSFNATTAPAGSLAGEFKVRGVNLDLVGTLPMTERLSALLRVGVQRSSTRASFAGTGAVTVLDPSRRENSTGAKLGAGLQYEFSPWMLVRAEAERLRVADAVGSKGNVNMVSMSLVFPLGRVASAAPRVAMAPRVEVMAPAPAPVQPPPPPAPPPEPVLVVAPVVPAAPPVLRRVSFSAESLFGFDRSELRPEGRGALDTFAGELDGTTFSVITVEGHTDRLGTAEYNQTLSLQRADAVRSYLVTTGKVEAGKITTQGKGETTPVTQARDCPGTAPSPKLITCLQPDRRVELAVVGTR